jgi:phenylacetate-CoA ligase
LAQPDPDASTNVYRYNAVERQVYLSPYHLSSATVGQYLAALERHRTVWATGYAVSFYLLASLAEAAGLAAPTLEAIVTTSEKLTPKMRVTMERVFSCRVFEEYSTVENVIFASECEHGSLHVSPDACYVEILRPDGRPTDPGEVGEVVATGLIRSLQPLVRYRLGDLAAWSAVPCACGRHMPVLEEVIGRLEDVVVGPDGRRLVRFHGVFVDLPSVREGQVIQHAVDRLTIRVVPEPNFTSADEDAIRRRVKQRLGSSVEVAVELVPHIERDQRGKFRAVVSLLPKDPTRSLQ